MRKKPRNKVSSHQRLTAPQGAVKRFLSRLKTVGRGGSGQGERGRGTEGAAKLRDQWERSACVDLMNARQPEEGEEEMKRHSWCVEHVEAQRMTLCTHTSAH